MSVRNRLLALERGFWTGDAGFYRNDLDDVCVMAFADMAGAFGKEDIAGTIANSERWSDPEIEVTGVLEPVAGIAILTCRARARKSSGPYAGVVTSG